VGITIGGNKRRCSAMVLGFVRNRSRVEAMIPVETSLINEQVIVDGNGFMICILENLIPSFFPFRL
jgi:hypothetical protein